jgi:RNA polymerase sigma-70 factor (ECF subfamily)
MTIPDDSALTAALVDDLDRGFVGLVETYQPGIYSGAYRFLRTPHDAEDVAQETFLRAYRALSTYDEDRIRRLSPRPWLWTIALNLCRNRWARSKPTSPLDTAPPVASIDHEPIDADVWNDRLGALSDSQRTAVVLRHVLDLPVGEIAEITGRPEGTVKADVSRGLARLRRVLETEGART